ncbi:hypothetical protein Bbelb_296150 [Branchiostoma belcheri]|nr:hypothetical protein Bbelb_296150 [Branchiostoma belcheri]
MGRSVESRTLSHILHAKISLRHLTFTIQPIQMGLREDPACKLCGERGTMAHILSSCKTALAQGRYRWRHDKVLTVLACSLEEVRKRKRQGSTRPGSTIAFVREGGERRTTTGRSREVGNILEKAKTWELRVDLGRKLQFPKVVQTKLRPDAVLWAEAEKKLVLVELTVPWEERCEEAYERKKNKYQELIDECRSKGWQAWLFPVEVGCRGFPAQSVWKLFTAIGVKGKERKVAVRKLVEEKKVAGSLAERMCSELAATAGPNNSRASRLRVETPKEEKFQDKRQCEACTTAARQNQQTTDTVDSSSAANTVPMDLQLTDDDDRSLGNFLLGELGPEYEVYLDFLATSLDEETIESLEDFMAVDLASIAAANTDALADSSGACPSRLSEPTRDMEHSDSQEVMQTLAPITLEAWDSAGFGDGASQTVEDEPMSDSQMQIEQRAAQTQTAGPDTPLISG